MLQDSFEVDDETKSKLNNTYCSVAELSDNRETHLRESLLVRVIINSVVTVSYWLRSVGFGSVLSQKPRFRYRFR